MSKTHLVMARPNLDGEKCASLLVVRELREGGEGGGESREKREGQWSADVFALVHQDVGCLHLSQKWRNVSY